MITWAANKDRLKIFDKGIIVAEIPSVQFARLIYDLADRLDQKLMDNDAVMQYEILLTNYQDAYLVTEPKD